MAIQLNNAVDNDTEYIYMSYNNASNNGKVTIIEKQIITESIVLETSITEEQKTDKQNETLQEILKEKIEEINVQKEQGIYKETITKLTEELVSVLKYYIIDIDNIALVERKICDIARKYSFTILGDVIQTIYVRYNDQYNMLAGICKVLCRYDLQEVMPWGPTMLVGLLNNKNEIVKECAVELVENWADTEMIPILKNLECSTQWLKDYINDVVKNLEAQNVLCKKIV